MEQYLKNVLGCNIKKEIFDFPLEMPQYLRENYFYEKYIIENQECLFVVPLDFSFSAYKKHQVKLERITNIRVVLCLESVTWYQRKTLIEEHVPFIVKNSQIFLPFLAIYLTEKYREVTEIEKFTPITQLVFLYLFYNKIKISATELADKIGYTTMSVTRAYKSLVDCGLFHIEHHGVKKYILPNSKGGELLRNTERFFISPVEKTIRVNGEPDVAELVASGIYALSKKTMLNATIKDRCFAVYRKKNLNFENVVRDDWYNEETVTTIEKWSYDPNLLASDGSVDDISLLITLKNDNDERIQIEAEKLRSKYQW